MSEMSLSACIPRCRSLGCGHGHGHGHIPPNYPHQCSCPWLGVGVVSAWASCCFCMEKHRDFSLDCDTALRNEWGLEKTNLNNSWQRVGKEQHAHSCLSNSDSFGGAGEAGAGSSWAEPESGSLSGHLLPPEVIYPMECGRVEQLQITARSRLWPAGSLGALWPLSQHSVVSCKTPGLAQEDRAHLQTLHLQGEKTLEKPQAVKSKLKKKKNPTNINKKNASKNPSPTVLSKQFSHWSDGWPHFDFFRFIFQTLGQLLC